MNKNVINFYMMSNNLKNVIRKGWQEVGIPRDKIESVADHVCGTMILSLGIIEENKLDIDIAKLFKMIILKELSKAITNDEQSIINHNTKEGVKAATDKILTLLDNSSDLIALYDEYENKSSKEATFAYKVSKLESDLQAKIYEQNGDFTLENALKDIENFPEEVKSKMGEVTKASDGWLAFDRDYYEDDELFLSLSKEIQEME